MSSPSKARGPAARRERGEKRRREILDATLRVIARQGVARVTHRAVAAEGGVPLAATTYYFASKTELLIEACRHHVERQTKLVEGIEAELGHGDLTPERAAEALARILSIELFPGREELMAEYELVLEAARRPELRELARTWSDRVSSRLQGWLRKLGSTNPRVDAALVLAAATGIEIEGLASGRGEVDAAALRRLLTRLLRGLLSLRGPRRGG
jgi:DNA-binding transcriptional regulator YbjK